MSSICNTDWGMGTTVHGNGHVGYGYPETDNPHKYEPDYEVCTELEIENWKKAKEDYKHD